jgi:hypothetical protein
MKRALISVLLLGAFSLYGFGCASTYTGIRQVSGNTYMVTRVSQGLFANHGDLLRCEAAGETMNCTQVGTP